MAGALSSEPETIVLIHGFGGTGRTWDGVLARLSGESLRPLALDLPGHGGDSGGEQRITFAGCVERVLGAAPGRIALCGYSLGGRIALHAALEAPERVSRLVLVSTSAGIEDGRERARRVLADEELAQHLERGAYEEFLERWSRQPLFADDPPAVSALARADQLRNTPKGLAAVLRGVGAGQMEPLWDRLGELAMPVTVLVGERDVSYRALGRRLVEQIADAELVLAAGGHRLALENPVAVADAITGSRAGRFRGPTGAA